MEIITSIKYWTIARLPKRFRFLLPDKIAIKMRFRKRFGRELNLKAPQTLNEKLNWQKLYDRNPLMTKCVDKYAVREIVEEKIGGHILNELYGVWENVDEIDFNSLPESYVLKTTHGSGWNVIVNKNSDFDINDIKQKLRNWMKKNYYSYSREWCYKNVQPKIICEKYMEDKNGKLVDYKIHCFHGKPQLIQVDLDRYSDHKRALYNIQWEKYNFQWGYPSYEKKLSPPDCLAGMLEIAGALSRDFLYARIDMYDVDGSPFFGEISFQHGAGIEKFIPQHWDADLGKLLKLPIEV